MTTKRVLCVLIVLKGKKQFSKRVNKQSPKGSFFTKQVFSLKKKKNLEQKLLLKIVIKQPQSIIFIKFHPLIDLVLLLNLGLGPAKRLTSSPSQSLPSGDYHIFSFKKKKKENLSLIGYFSKLVVMDTNNALQQQI